MDGWRNPIKKLPEDEQDSVIHKTITYLANVYGNRVKITPILLKKCILDIKKNFSHYGKMEFTEAFRLWSLGEIGDKSTEMYGGEFNALILNRILKQYENYRRDIVNKSLRELEKQKNQEKERAERERHKEEIDKIPKEQIISDINKYDNWENIPHYLCKIAFKKKLIKLTKSEIEEYKKQAKQKHKEEIEIERNKISSVNDLLKINKEMQEPEVRERIIATKICVFDKLHKRS